MLVWLIDIREAASLSQKEVSERLKIAQPTYSNIENGKRGLSVKLAKRIGAELGFDWQRFYEDKEQTNA